MAIDEILMEWVKDMVMKKRFRNVTHAVELGLQKMKEAYERGEIN